MYTKYEKTPRLMICREAEKINNSDVKVKPPPRILNGRLLRERAKQSKCSPTLRVNAPQDEENHNSSLNCAVIILTRRGIVLNVDF